MNSLNELFDECALTDSDFLYGQQKLSEVMDKFSNKIIDAMYGELWDIKVECTKEFTTKEDIADMINELIDKLA